MAMILKYMLTADNAKHGEKNRRSVPPNNLLSLQMNSFMIIVFSDLFLSLYLDELNNLLRTLLCNPIFLNLN